MNDKMKSTQPDDKNILNKVLIAIIIFLVIVIAMGTIFGLLNRKNQTPEILISQGKAESLMAPADTNDVTYYELGTLRISTASDKSEENGCVMVLSPWLAYPAGDTVLFEEISRKSGSIKGIFQAYFSARTKNQLLTETEEHIESIIKDEINADLALGKISDIYFTDYLFLE